jgi:glycosyltransferase involved in cell wall biosynthesis
MPPNEVSVASTRSAALEDTEAESPILSICIPTFNRCARVVALVQDLLSVEARFEVCVHVDGSTDGTYEALIAIKERRLSIATAANQGRASALLSACRLARGRFLMVFDDDDVLYLDGLRTVLADCARPLPEGAVGFIYHLEDRKGVRIGSAFPVARSNFLALRADHGIKGDKKEVVLANALLAVAYDSRGRFRRTPTSLVWSRLALTFDVVCRDAVIGRKVYLDGGMSANIRSLKSRNAYPMTLLYAAHIQAFARGRYRSPRFLLKALAGLAHHGTQAAVAALRPNSGAAGA